MLTAVAIIPSAPVLVPQLAGVAAAELTDLRAAVRTAAQALPARWIVVGAGERHRLLAPQTAGTFAGYGADVPVALSPGEHPVTDMPLCALVAGWVRTQDRPDAMAEVRCYPTSSDNESALAQGRELRAEIDADAGAVGVLVVADGWHTLTPGAPGGYDQASVPEQGDLDDALARGDGAALTRLPAGVIGRVPLAVLAGLTGCRSVSARELYRGAPYGVGYFAGIWTL